MDRVEKEATVRVLLTVARADGVVDDDERRTLGVVAAAIGVPGPVDRTVDLEAELVRVRSPEARELLVTAAHAMANIDGRCTPEEYAILARIHEVVWYDGMPDIEAAEREWATRMSDVRDIMSRATAQFLHAVAALGDAPSVSYEALVQELDGKKRAALGRALGA
jgi:tellurite resistance protein